MIKKSICLILALVMCVSMCACGKSKAVKAAEDAIVAIGEVTVDSGDVIANAEKLYGILTDEEKAGVENRLTLVDAREEFEALKGELVYKNAEEAYEKLKNIAELCVDGMDAVYGAWYFGIYEADDTTDSSFCYEMSLEVPGFTETELEEAVSSLGEDIGFGEELTIMLARSDWQYCLWIVEEAISIRGDYATINTYMEDAEKILQELTEEYDDYTYYPKLKDYYAAIKSYVEFFSSPSCSFNQLVSTINDYENGIRTLESDVGFLFNK